MSLDPDLIDRLGAAAVECRELLADVHTAVKLLRSETKLADEARAKLTAAADKAIETGLQPAVDEAMRQLGEAVGKTIKLAERRVHQRFEAIADIMLQASRDDGGLEGVARRIALQQHLRDGRRSMGHT